MIFIEVHLYIVISSYSAWLIAFTWMFLLILFSRVIALFVCQIASLLPQEIYISIIFAEWIFNVKFFDFELNLSFNGDRWHTYFNRDTFLNLERKDDKKWLIDYCWMSSEQYFIYIQDQNKFNNM